MKKKKCKYTTAQIGQYMMNKMSPEEETLLQEHLYSCPECQRKLQEMRKLANALTNESLRIPAKPKRRQRHFVKILVSILLLCSGSYCIYLWKSSLPDTPIIHTVSPPVYHHADSLQQRDTINPSVDSLK